MIAFVIDLLRVLASPCRSNTFLLSKQFDAPLSRGEELGLRIHLRVCRGCFRFQAQLRQLRALLSATDGSDAAAAAMPETVRTRLQDRLAQELNKKTDRA